MILYIGLIAYLFIAIIMFGSLHRRDTLILREKNNDLTNSAKPLSELSVFHTIKLAIYSLFCWWYHILFSIGVSVRDDPPRMDQRKHWQPSDPDNKHDRSLYFQMDELR